MRDLEIRGAGELLGAEQSGHVAAVGFELYVELLNEAVAELSGPERVAARPVRVDARVDAYVPAAYIGSEALKIDLHRRLALVEDEDELRELRAAVEDRYGELPEPVENLFAIQEAKLKLARVGADYLVFRGGRITSVRWCSARSELRELRDRAATAVYTCGKHEVALRQDDFREALELVDAIARGAQRHESGSRRSPPCRRGVPAAADTTTRRCRRGAVAVVGERADAAERSRRRSSPSRARAYAARRAGVPGAGDGRLPSGSRTDAVRLLVDRDASWSSRRRRLGIVIRPAQVDARLRRFKQTAFGGERGGATVHGFARSA